MSGPAESGDRASSKRTVEGKAGEGRRRLYVVANSHLDTQWRWNVREVIASFLPKTVREIGQAFERFPRYVQSFEGSFRYLLFEEYYPEGFADIRRWVDEGRWHPAGSMLESPDVIIPAPESLLRHLLIGSRYFRERLGRPTRDLFLPDCFGFSWSLPTIARHCGIRGFSSQKHTNWGDAPFDIGIWEGPDGSELLTVLLPGGYGNPIEEDLSRSPEWRERIDEIGERCGSFVGYKYFGVGDRGGAPDDGSLRRLERAAASEDGVIEVVPAPSDAYFLDPGVEEAEGWPRHRGELLLTTHGTGCLTSQAGLKRWNRRSEETILAAEAAAVAADWLGATPYRGDDFREAWIRFLWHQHHDDLTGTSIPSAYGITWNDEAVAANRIDGLLRDAVEGVAAGLDTSVDGEPVVVFNPLALPREDVIELELPDPAPGRAWTVRDGDGDPLVSQWQPDEEKGGCLLVSPRLPSLGLVVLELIQEEETPSPSSEGPRVDGRSLENGRYRVEIDEGGRVASIRDRSLGRELLAGPVDLVLLSDRSRRWPAWEVLWKDVSREPRSRARGPVEVRAVERGPVRAALEVSRRIGRSRVIERVSLARGAAGDRVEWWAEIDWRDRRRLLKATFSLAPSDPEATFDLGLGAIRRGNGNPDKYEVPAQQWADLTDADEDFGVSILSESRPGWDKLDDRTLRLSLLRAPWARWRFRHQATQDHGRHRVGWALRGHRGSWSGAGIVEDAARFNRPPIAFRARCHSGPLGRSFAFLDLGGDGWERGVAPLALKRSEDGEDVVLRVREITGAGPSPLSARFPGPVVVARRADGTEVPGEAIEPSDGVLADRLGAFGLASYRLRVEEPEARIPPPDGHPVSLPLDTSAASFHSGGGPVAFDGSGRSLPGELLPGSIHVAGVRLDLGPILPGEPHCVSCRGQVIDLPVLAPETGGQILLVATSAGVSRSISIGIEGEDGAEDETIFVPSWRRLLAARRRREAEPVLRHRERIAWTGTHRHDRRLRDEPYRFCYLFAYRLDLPAGARFLRLPDEPEIRLFAATVADGGERRLERATRDGWSKGSPWPR